MCAVRGEEVEGLSRGGEGEGCGIEGAGSWVFRTLGYSVGKECLTMGIKKRKRAFGQRNGSFQRIFELSISSSGFSLVGRRSSWQI